MNAILEPVVVISQGLLQPKRYCVQGTSGQRSSKIVSLSLRSATLAKFSRKMRAHPAPLHPVVAVGPFAKWGIDFTTCNPPSAAGHHYIIVAVDYFMKWAEAMPTYTNDA